MAAASRSARRSPYLPILEWLGGLAHEGGDIGAEAASIHDLFGGLVDASVGEAAPGRSAQLRRLGDLLARIAADADVIAVIDDLHWADRSTLDVVTFLARRLARTGVVLVLAFRSDELHRRHPLRPVLAGLERHATLDHVRLAALDDAAVMAQVAAIAGVTVDATEPRVSWRSPTGTRSTSRSCSRSRAMVRCRRPCAMC